MFRTGTLLADSGSFERQWRILRRLYAAVDPQAAGFQPVARCLPSGAMGRSVTLMSPIARRASLSVFGVDEA